MRTLSFPPVRVVARLSFAVAAVIALGAVGRAQNQPAQSPAPAAPQAVVQDDVQEQVFRSSVTLATTDLIVRDKDGLFVSDVGLEDLVVYEDGEEQEVASLVLVHGGQVFDRLLPPVPVQEGIVMPRQRPVDSTSGRVFVIFVDDVHLEPGLTPNIRKVFKDLADSVIHEGDLFALISSGPSSLNIDLTHDRSLLYSAMERITGDGLTPREYVNEVQSGSNGPIEIRWRVHKAFKLAREILGNLERLKHRRKAFLYLSSGYDFNPFQEQRLKNSVFGQAFRGALADPDADPDSERYLDLPVARMNQLRRLAEPGSTFGDADLAYEMADLAQSANRANATFYTIDPRGLMARPSIEYDVDLQQWNSHVSQQHFTMRMLAELTGGFAVVNTNNFGDAFARVDAETSDYYVVGFYSNNTDSSVRTRRLRIEVKRPDVTVRHRTHYTYEDPLDQVLEAPTGLNP